MSIRTHDYLDAIEHLPDGATLIIHQSSWDGYERILEDLSDRPHLRVSYDRGRLEIMSPLPEHEEYCRFIDDLIRLFCERVGLTLDALELSKTEGQTAALRSFRNLMPDVSGF